jgi:mitochondrial chaperone BCS1
MTDVLLESLRANDMFAGGLLLMFLGTTITLAYRLIPAAAHALVRRFTVSLEVRHPDIFLWLGDWLAQQSFADGYRRLSVDLLHVASDGHGEARTMLVFAPGRGVHIVRHGGRWFWVERRLEADSAGGHGRRPLEVYTLRAAGTNPTVLKDAISAASRLQQERRRGRIAVHCVDRHDGWHRLELQAARSLESVVLQAGISERITADMKAFLTSGDWYQEVGVPHRRGYLFHGPPGCGKTTFARAVAAHFGMDIYVVGIASAGMTDERLAIELARTRPRSVLLLEDVDSAFAERKREADNSSHVKSSGLLNALDGVAAQEHRVLIMTTNHIDRLDPALIRPGRVDVQQYFGLLDADQALSLFLRFFPGAATQAAAAARAVGESDISPAWMQNVLLANRGRPESAVATLRTTATRRWLLAVDSGT